MSGGGSRGLESLRVLVVDDEPYNLDRSRAALGMYLPAGNVVGATSAQEAIEALRAQDFGMVFLDIEMPDTTGFSMAEYVHANYPRAKVVFLTGHVELGARSFDYEPFDFLVKPVDVMRVRKTLDRYLAQQAAVPQRRERVALDTGTELVMLAPEDIRYISKEGRKTVIHCADKDYAEQYSLEELEAIFEDFGMIRTHQSFIVPLARVAGVQSASVGKTYAVRLDDGTTVPMSRIQYGKFRDRLAQEGIRVL